MTDHLPDQGHEPTILPHPILAEETVISIRLAQRIRGVPAKIASVLLHARIQGKVRCSDTGIVVYADAFDSIRYGVLGGIVSQSVLHAAGEIRQMCASIGCTFEYGWGEAPPLPEPIHRTLKSRVSGFRPPQLPLQPAAVPRPA